MLYRFAVSRRVQRVMALSCVFCEYASFLSLVKKQHNCNLKYCNECLIVAIIFKMLPKFRHRCLQCHHKHEQNLTNKPTRHILMALVLNYQVFQTDSTKPIGLTVWHVLCKYYKQFLVCTLMEMPTLQTVDINSLCVKPLMYLLSW